MHNKLSMASNQNSKPIHSSIFQTLNDIKITISQAIFLKCVDIDDMNISYLHIISLLMFISFATYVSFILSSLIRLKFLTAFVNLFFPAVPLLGCLFLGVYAYSCSIIYSDLLNDNDRSIKRNMYIIIAASIHLPICILVANLIKRF